ncbi:hypothetical protein [Aliivibrio fischeri]|uniref:pPIWI-associating nuclease domain-containing protein n=1 Tax=Aliivibrio fischeri TaxID=668 RepID=UPI0007C556E6|nr:hypothetical protein [Aliivibrio fischeri]
MKLKKLQSLDFIQEFSAILDTPFEKELLKASLRNYSAHGNPIRFHNFAFTMRELVLHVFERRAPKKKVKAACWYERESEKLEVTRRQQIKYCAQKGIADEYLDEYVLEELNERISDYLKEFNFFNKYTHITEKHFNACPKKFFADAKYIVQRSHESLSELDDFEDLIKQSLYDRVYDCVVETAISSTPDEVSILSANSIVDSTDVEDVTITKFDNEKVYLEVTGTVYVTQEYGGKHDYFSMECDYPFTLEMAAKISDPNDIEVLSNELKVDTSSWYE